MLDRIAESLDYSMTKVALMALVLLVIEDLFTFSDYEFITSDQSSYLSSLCAVLVLILAIALIIKIYKSKRRKSLLLYKRILIAADYRATPIFLMGLYIWLSQEFFFYYGNTGLTLEQHQIAGNLVSIVVISCTLILIGIALSHSEYK